jgi:hypothetical protein
MVRSGPAQTQQTIRQDQDQGHQARTRHSLLKSQAGKARRGLAACLTRPARCANHDAKLELPLRAAAPRLHGRVAR